MVEAFEALDRVMRAEGTGHLLSRKKSHSFGGRTVKVGQIGVLTYKGRPILVHKPGQYWNFSWTHNWFSPATYDLTNVNSVYGLTFAQVGQSEALVCMDPANQVFVLRNSGFAAYGSAGSYKVIEVVDTLNLGESCAVYETAEENSDEKTRRILGYKKEVKHKVTVNGVSQSNTIATFFNVPAQNTVVIQYANHLEQAGAGQHVITNPRATFRGFFTYSERQQSFRTQPAYTLEGVPVVLHVNLRYRVVDAIKLTMSYETAFQALKNPAQSAVNAVVSRLSYQQFMRAKRVNGDIPDIEHVTFLEAFKENCMADLSIHAIEFGVRVLSFDVLDRRLEGKLGEDLEKQAESVLKNQMQSTQVGLQNKINTETEQGRLEVAGVRALQVKTEADAMYYKNLKEADTQAETIKRLAQANADANKIETEQRVRAIEMLARADATATTLQGQSLATVTSPHGQRMQLEEVERKKIAALPERATLFVGGGTGDASSSSSSNRQVTDGYAWQSGLSLGRVSGSA